MHYKHVPLTTLYTQSMNVYLGQHWSVNKEHAVIAKYEYKIMTGLIVGLSSFLCLRLENNVHFNLVQVKDQ